MGFKSKVFGIATIAGAAMVVSGPGLQRYADARTLATVAPRVLSDYVHVSTQLDPGALKAVGRRYSMVIDMRPDGEVPGQPSSDEMRHAAGAQHVGFRYIPVPHGDIPETAITELRKTLDAGGGAVLLYCRSGRRAARTWALAEAGRPGGLSADSILAAVHAAGQDAGDLMPRIQSEIQKREARHEQAG
jgi:uncharacterized protein (TIGR01244 family)